MANKYFFHTNSIRPYWLKHNSMMMPPKIISKKPNLESNMQIKTNKSKPREKLHVE